VNLLEFTRRPARPEPWSEGDNLPWNDPAFSERMLKEHLTQEHNHASRRDGWIERHVAWVRQVTAIQPPARVLDLACGPGLYTTRLARLGHPCQGIDFSPASIRHARQTADAEGLDCTYLEADLRQADFGEGFDLAMLLFGELNVFRRQDAQTILTKARQALKPGGWLVLEPQTLDSVRSQGQAGSTWYTSAGGLFSPQPYLALEESFWYAERQTAVIRYVVIDAASAALSLYSSSVQGYTQDEYRQLLEQSGFEQVRFYPSLAGDPHPDLEGMLAITARRS
jgi:ubiquinone/menaquinone biosynthesis C-methylase UbiE